MKAGRIVFEGVTEKGVEITIRYPLLTDTEKTLNFVNTLSAEHTFIRYQGEQLTLAEESEIMKEQTDKIKKGMLTALFAFSGSELVGTSSISLGDKTSAHVGEFGIMIASKLRHQGIGKLLMRSVLTEAMNNHPGLKIVTLCIFDGNEIARKMYEAFGFKEYGILPEGLRYRNQFINHIYMYKKLR